MYRQLGIYVVLVGIEVWSERNRINVTGNADETMNNFLEYRRSAISPHYRNDNAQLIVSASADCSIRPHARLSRGV